MEDNKGPTDELKPETGAETDCLNAIMKRLDAQWHLDVSKMYDKRVELLKLLREVGPARFNTAIDQTLTHHTGDFCPTIAQIRARVPLQSGGKHYLRHRCPVCSNGWVYLEDLDSAGNQQVKRCPNLKDPAFMVEVPVA